MIKKQYLNNKETIHNFIWRFLQIGGKQGATLLIFFMSAYFLAPEKFGLFSYLMALVGLFIIFCDFGISSATSKYITEYKTKRPKEVNKILFSVSTAIVSLATIISLLIIFLGRYIFKEYLLLLYFIPYLFLFPLTSTLDGAYRGLKDFKRLSVITLIVGFISLIASYFLIKSYLLVGAIISQNLLFFLLAISLFIFREEIEFKINKNILKKVIKYSVIIGIINIMFFLYTGADILILKYFGYVVEIGYYEIVNKLFMIILIPSMLLGQVLAPDITRDYSLDKFSIVKKKFLKYISSMFVLSIFLIAFLYFLFPVLIKLFLEDYFTKETLLIFKLLLIVLPLKFMASITNHAHTVPSGNAHLSMWTMIPAGIANIILDFYFISIFGFIGVVYATLICYAFATTSFMILYYIKLSRLIKNEAKK
jgi:O-antigen/teichoic acid export membrane protein